MKIMDDLLKEAICEAEKQPEGKEFRVKDLFQGVIWESFSKGDRMQLGRNFKRKVKEKSVVCVVYVRKAENNSAIYRRK